MYNNIVLFYYSFFGMLKIMLSATEENDNNKLPATDNPPDTNNLPATTDLPDLQIVEITPEPSAPELPPFLKKSLIDGILNGDPSVFDMPLPAKQNQNRPN